MAAASIRIVCQTLCGKQWPVKMIAESKKIITINIFVAVLLTLSVPIYIVMCNSGMSALLFPIMVGLAAVRNKSNIIVGILEKLKQVVLIIVTVFVILILPILIGAALCGLSYEGTHTKQLPIFLTAIAAVMIGRCLRRIFCVLLSARMARIQVKALAVLKSCGYVYVAALGAVSSAATLLVALFCAKNPNLHLVMTL